MRLRLDYNLTMAKVRNCVWVSPSSILTIAHNLFRQFLNVTFNEIFCILALFLFYGTPAEYIASGNSWWLLWPKCWLETEFDCRFRLRFSQFNQVNQTNCAKAYVIFCFEIMGAISWSKITQPYVTFFHEIEITKKILRFSFWKVYIPILH